MVEPAPIAWSRLSEHRREIAARFGNVYALPIAKRVQSTVLDHLPRGPGLQILEVGAGGRTLEKAIRARSQDVRYESMDIDLSTAQDYYDLDSVPSGYDAIVAIEVVEHLDAEAIPAWLTLLADKLRPGGRLILSTPNVYHPPAYLRDATHRTPLAYDELAGLVEAAGLEAKAIFRIFSGPLLRRVGTQILFGWLFRMLGLDYAKHVVLIADKPEQPSRS